MKWYLDPMGGGDGGPKMEGTGFLQVQKIENENSAKNKTYVIHNYVLSMHTDFQPNQTKIVAWNDKFEKSSNRVFLSTTHHFRYYKLKNIKNLNIISFAKVINCGQVTCS